MPRPLALLAGVFVLLLGTGGAALALAAGEGSGAGEPHTVLVSRKGADGPGGDGNSIEPAISGNGRYVAFVSRAGNLVPGVKAGPREVYVRDLVAKRTVLASRANGARGTPATGYTAEPTISADGRYVAFTASPHLTADPTGSAYSEVYLRDLATNTTTLVSRASAPGNAPADNQSGAPAISADGRHVAFDSSADNLSPEDLETGDEDSDVFVRDLDTGVTELVSRATGPTGAAGDRLSLEPSISADGRYVAFESRAQLVPDDVDETSEGTDVFVRDRATATTQLVSRKSGVAGAAANVQSSEAAISADGRFVVFESDAKLTGQRGYGQNVFLRDLVTQTTKLVTVGQKDSGYGQFVHPAISADGRYVAFESGGIGLTKVDPRNRVDVFARDMVKGVTVDVARASGTLGLPADGPSGEASISADGRYVAFESRAGNLSGADGKELADVFRRNPVYAKEKPLPQCAGRPATIIGTPQADTIRGTKRADVIIALGGDDKIQSFNGPDAICAGPGKDTVDAGSNGEYGGSDLVLGGPGDDHLKLGPELGTLKGEGGNDVLVGSKGGDSIFGGPGADLILGGPNPTYNTDFLYGGPGNDRIYGGPGPNAIHGGPGHNVVEGDNR